MRAENILLCNSNGMSQSVLSEYTTFGTCTNHMQSGDISAWLGVAANIQMNRKDQSVNEGCTGNWLAIEELGG